MGKLNFLSWVFIFKINSSWEKNITTGNKGSTMNYAYWKQCLLHFLRGPGGEIPLGYTTRNYFGTNSDFKCGVDIITQS